MAQTEGSIVIEADAASVMKVIADFESYPEWNDLKSVEVRSSDEAGRGVEVAYEVSAMGFDAAYTLLYEYEPSDAGVSWTTKEASGAIRQIDGAYVLDPAEDGTEVTYRLTVEPAVPAPGFIRRQLEKKVVGQALKALKARVEQG